MNFFSYFLFLCFWFELILGQDVNQGQQPFNPKIVENQNVQPPQNFKIDEHANLNLENNNKKNDFVPPANNHVPNVINHQQVGQQFDQNPNPNLAANIKNNEFVPPGNRAPVVNNPPQVGQQFGHNQNHIPLPNNQPAVIPYKLQQQFAQKQPASQRKNPLVISQTAECEADVQRVCLSNQYNLANNFDVLSCLSVEVENDELSDDCSHYIWEYKLNMTKNAKFHSIVRNLCLNDFQKFPDCDTGKLDGAMVACMTEHKDKIKDPRCLEFLKKVEIIIFNDYHFIHEFLSDCEKDVTRLHCGKFHSVPVQSQLSGAYHSQEKVLQCLQDHLDDDDPLQPKCMIQIIRLAEFSADDYHLDKHLYIRCKNDRETFCADVPSGEGRVYKCLFEHKQDQLMSKKCSEALTGREELIAEDYKASSTLVLNCHLDILNNNCEHTLDPLAKKPSQDTPHMVHLASILMCLETSKSNGVPISDQCQSELVDYRNMLLGDYQLVPEIVKNCADEILNKCDRGRDKEGKTLHCLFNLARQRSGVSAKCSQELFNVVQETDVAGDYRMDAVLTEACQSMIDVKCTNFKEGDPMVVGCLMDHLHDPDMKKSCQKAVIDIQYFISRNFRIDPTFRDACGKDSEQLCFAPLPEVPLPGEALKDPPKHPPMPLSLVISCLYRHIHPKDASPPGKSLSQECEEKVHVLLKQRALDVNLNPDLEQNCRTDLGRFCSRSLQVDSTEFVCLQDHYNDLSAECRAEVKSLTQMEGQNSNDFENILVKECEPMLKEFCGHLLHESDEGKVLACLINNKEKMKNEKCKAGITHFQLIEMKDFELDLKFTTACMNDIKKHCSQHGDSRPEVVKCLSEVARNHKLSDGKSEGLSEQCAAEVTVDKLQMHRNILLNPDLKDNCQVDIDKLCQHVKSGEAQVIECLREHQADISPRCRIHLFQFKKEESKDRSLDFQLLRKCKRDINKHCFEDQIGANDDADDSDDDYVLECLVENKHMLEKACKAIVTKREKEIFSDISLNEELQSSCMKDIDNHCAQKKLEAAQDHKEGEDPHGVIYECLKETFADKTVKLSSSCHEHMEKVIREQQQDYALDPQLMIKCIKSIERLCPPKDGFNVVECLKKEYFKESLSNDKKCMMEVAKLLNEGLSDIMADPLLQQACVNDLERHCSSIPEGNGRLISCLVNAVNEGKPLSSQCYEQVQARKEMWNKSLKGVGGFSDLHQIVLGSQHSSYIFSILTCVILIVLILGVFCGRITKRAARYKRLV